MHQHQRRRAGVGGGLLLLYSLALVALGPVKGESVDDSLLEDKRNVATLARNGELPYRQEWKKFVHPLTWQMDGRTLQEVLEKRFLHPVTTSWKSSDRDISEALEKRFSHPMTSVLQAELRKELEKRLTHPMAAALQAADRAENEVLHKRFSHPITSVWHPPVSKPEDKRNVGSLARAGNLGKRADEEEATLMADALLAEVLAEILLRQQMEEEEEEELEQQDTDNSLMDKRFVASVARTGGLPGGKRNIAAMARDGYLKQNRARDEAEEQSDAEESQVVEAMLDEVAKRHLGSLARSFDMPAGLTSGGKRNVGALARSGLLTRLSGGRDEAKREYVRGPNRGRYTGKRSLLRGQYLPFAYARLSGVRDSFVDPGKRNIQALLKSWRPVEGGSGHGKRYNSYLITNEIPSTRRYIAALMNSPARVLGQQNDEQKRHLGSLLGGQTGSTRGKTVQKKSVVPAVPAAEAPVVRTKRQIPGMDGISVEYPMPVLQGSDFYDFEEELPAAAEEKRFLGRIPHMGRGIGKIGGGGAGDTRRRPRGGAHYYSPMRPPLYV